MTPMQRRVLGSTLVLAVAVLATPVWVALARTNAQSLTAERALFNPAATASFPDMPTGHPRAGMWSALFALSRNNPGAAVTSLQTVNTGRPLSQLELVVLGRAYFAQGSLDRAIGTWSKADAWLEMVRAAEQLNTHRRWGDALILVSAARAAMPREVVSSEATADRGMGDPERALVVLDRAQAVWPSAPESTTWLLSRGDALYDLKRWDESLQSYQHVSMSSDPSVAYWGFLGMGRATYRSGGGFAVAAAPIAHAISLFPNQRAAYAVMADLLRSERRTDEALTWERRAAAMTATAR
jgi:tetratricopeptide (TPR) repeat protein